jgi:hypothetical protein
MSRLAYTHRPPSGWGRLVLDSCGADTALGHGSLRDFLAWGASLAYLAPRGFEFHALATEQPRAFAAQLLADFAAHVGALPFANIKA